MKPLLKAYSSLFSVSPDKIEIRVTQSPFEDFQETPNPTSTVDNSGCQFDDFVFQNYLNFVTLKTYVVGLS